MRVLRYPRPISRFIDKELSFATNVLVALPPLRPYFMNRSTWAADRTYFMYRITHLGASSTRAFFCSTRTTHLGSPPLRPYTPPALQCFGGLPSAAVGHLFRTAGEWEAFSTSCWKPFSPFWTLRRSWPPRALRRPTSGAPRDHPAYPSVCRVPSFLHKQDRLRAQDLLTTSLDHYVPTYHYIPYTLSTLGGE